MFRSSKVYIQIGRNQVTTINLNTGEQVFRWADAPFSSKRNIVGDFNRAEETLVSALRDLEIRTLFTRLKIVIQQTEGAEGGLDEIEKRALRDLAEQAGANQVYLAEHEKILSIEEASALL